MSSEIWRPIPGFPHYDASSRGRIRRRAGTPLCRAHRIRKSVRRRPGKRKVPYLAVMLSHGNRQRLMTVHRLVTLAFHGEPPTPKHEAAHRDGKPAHNRPDNLRWVFPAENVDDQIRHGTKPLGAAHPQAKLSAEAVAEIRSSPRTRGYSGRLARKFGVHPRYVRSIAEGKRRRYG